MEENNKETHPLLGSVVKIYRTGDTAIPQAPFYAVGGVFGMTIHLTPLKADPIGNPTFEGYGEAFWTSFLNIAYIVEVQ